MVQLSEQAGDRLGVLNGLLNRMAFLFMLGEVVDVDQEMERYQRLAEELRLPAALWQAAVFRAMRALFDGRLGEAESLAQQALAVGQRVEGANALQMFGVQTLALRREQGRFREVEAPLKGFIQQYPAIPAWRTPLPFLYAEYGQEKEAREEFEPLAASDFAILPRDGNWPIAMALLAETCHFLGDRARAQQLYRHLQPYAGRCIIVGLLADCYGTGSRLLGYLATTLERWDDAERHFQDAVEMNARMGSGRWTSWTQYHYADMLLRRDGAGDREKALSLLSQALDTAQALGLTALLERALALKLKAQGIESSGLLTSIDTVAREVYMDKPDLRPHAAPDGTVTIMFSDIEGSTAMADRLGDKRFMEVLREHNSIVREQVKSHRGFEVKSEGDGFMIAFQSARRALQCATAIQQAFDERNKSAKEPVRVRIGVHTGEAIKEGEDFFGKNVILAARIASQAEGGEILASGLLKGLVESGGDVTFGEQRVAELKGLAGTHEIWPVAWAGR